MLTSDTDGISLDGASRMVRETDEASAERSITVEAVTVDEVIASERNISIFSLTLKTLKNQPWLARSRAFDVVNQFSF